MKTYLLAAALLAAALFLLPSDSAAESVAVRGLRAVDGDPSPEILRQANALLLQRIQATAGVFAVSERQVAEFLGDGYAAFSGCAANPCMRDLASFARVDRIVWGTVRRVAEGAGGYALSLSAVDARGGRAPTSLAQVCPGCSEADFLGSLIGLPLDGLALGARPAHWPVAPLAVAPPSGAGHAQPPPAAPSVPGWTPAPAASAPPTGESAVASPEPAPSARLRVRSQPGGAEVRAGDTLLGTSPLKATLAPGPLRLHLTKAGYAPVALELELRAGKPTDVKVRLERLPPTHGRLVLGSMPKGARIVIDGAERGVTPATLELLPGGHELRLELSGYQPDLRSVALRAGKTTKVKARLKKVPPPEGRLQIRSSPSGARVLVDGEDRGLAPATLTAGSGDHELRLELMGHEPWVREVQVTGGRTTRVKARLKKAGLPDGTGLLAVAVSARDARLTIDGEEQRAGARSAVQVAAGAHQVSVTAPGYEPYEREVRVAHGKKTTLQARLRRVPQPGFLSVETEPAGATVQAAGAQIGTTPLRRYSLPAGTYELRLHLEGHEPLSASVRVRSGKHERLEKRLKRLATALRRAPLGPDGCEPGKQKGPDTAEHCCWPGQAWAGAAGCVGKPTGCVHGMRLTFPASAPDAGTCLLPDCEPGALRQADGIHCCWPGQGWSSARMTCVGVPQCPEFYLVAGDTCTKGPEITDTDGDGIMDATDRCPKEPEDYDDFQSDDGCPDPDNDEDGLKDVDDSCPNEPEDKDGWRDDDGCPDPDNDADGLPDAQDRCPDDAEDKDGNQDDDGCPDDDDGDGVPDSDDRCADAQEDRDGFQDDDGCPDPDNDGDGILDANDACADRAEDHDLVEDGDGCPDDDNDGDGVPDRNDRCPASKEDGRGRSPSDGCALSRYEQFEVRILSETMLSHELYLYRGWSRFAGSDDGEDILSDLDDIHWARDQSITGVRFRFRAGFVALSIAAPIVLVEDRVGFHLSGDVGLNVFSWPRRDLSLFSVLNPSVGVGGSLAIDPFADPVTGVSAALGWYVRNVVYLGNVLFVIEKTSNIMPADADEVSDFVSIGIGFGL